MAGYDDDSQDFLNENFYSSTLLSDMGKSIVRKYEPTLAAQSVWRDFETHMSTSSKGLMHMCPLLSMADH